MSVPEPAAGAPAGRHPSRLPSPSGFGRRRSRGVLIGGVLGAVALVGVMLGFGLRHDPSDVNSVLIGRTAPAFSLPSLEGHGHVSLADYQGKVVVLNFWASWCADCRVEQPAMVTAWRRFRSRGVEFVGVSFQDANSSARSYAGAMGSAWPLAVDPGSRTALAYGVYGVPETFFIGPDGRIAAKHIGPLSYRQLTGQIARLLPGAAS